MGAESHITLRQLQQRIKSAVEQSVPLPVWITAEIAEIKVNYSGHCYIELVEKEKEEAQAQGTRLSSSTPRAQARAVIWRSQYTMISAYFESQTGQRLAAGMKILCKVIVTYHELYGLSLQITDIDPSYTLGEVERQKQLTINQLQADGVWDCNRQTALPRLVQRLAVISSATAAGYRDFRNELAEGGYAYAITLKEAVVQGVAAEESICAALSEIALEEELYDAVILIRGGGSSSDLSCFNSYRLCSYVAQFPLPVITGIGHDKDTSVADIVAHIALKTPTAVAVWLNERMASIENWLDEAMQHIADMAHTKSTTERLRIERQMSDLTQLSQRICHQNRTRLALYGQQVTSSAQLAIEREKLRLQSLQEAVEARDPHNILKMGFAVVRLGEEAQLSAANISKGQMLDIELADGHIAAEVKDVTLRSRN